jgi:hypothetical protein
MEMLMGIGIRPEARCLAATPGDIQLMGQSGCGLALIDEKIALASNLTTRPIAGAHWTADTAFVHHASDGHCVSNSSSSSSKDETIGEPENLDSATCIEARPSGIARIIHLHLTIRLTAPT